MHMTYKCVAPHLAARKVVDVPGVFTVHRLLLGVQPLAVIFSCVRVCLGSSLGATSCCLLLEMFL